MDSIAKTILKVLMTVGCSFGVIFCRFVSGAVAEVQSKDIETLTNQILNLLIKKREYSHDRSLDY